MKRFLTWSNFALLVICFAGCSKKDPAPIVCYLTSYTDSSSSFTYTETLQYDDKNRVISTISTSNGLPLETTTFVYGADGNLSTADFGGGTTATFLFDGDNRMIKRTLAPGGATNVNTYNAAGQHISLVSTNPDCPTCGYTITYSYPNTTTHNYSTAIAVGSTYTYTTVYEFDSHPNPYKPVLYSSTGTDNNITKEIKTTNGISETTTSTYTYNDKGYPLTKISSNGVTTAYSYNCK